MKKTAMILLTALMTLNLLHAQKENKKSVLGVNAGMAVPFQDFAGKEISEHAGFAALGPDIEIDFLRHGRFFGFSAVFGYASMFFNENAYRAEYDRMLGNYGLNTVKAGNYNILKGLVGFTLKFPEVNHIEMLAMLHVGCAISVHPELVVSNSELGTINTYQTDVAWSAMSNAGVRINYWLSGKYGLSLNFGANFTTPAFHDDTSILQAFFLPVRYQNINVGFIMNLSSDH